MSDEKESGPGSGQYSHLLDEIVGVGDAVLLSTLTEDAFVANLKKRYEAKEIYVRNFRGKDGRGGRGRGHFLLSLTASGSCFF